MEDPDSSEAAPILSVPSVDPILIFGRPCKLRGDTLTLRELHRMCAVLLTLVASGATAICFQRQSVGNVFNVRWLPILATFSTASMYMLNFVNIYMGGWGTANGRFWCDVIIMYVRGFNTMHTVSRFFTASALFSMVASLLGLDTCVPFICLLVVVAEWQAGLAENQNQYNIKFHDKFVDDDNRLTLETLHAYQTSHPIEHTAWSTFIVSSGLKAATLTSIFTLAASETYNLVFRAPVIVSILMWAFMVTALLDFAYLKQSITFCQLEIYRMLSDTIFLPLIIMFALV